MMKIEKIKKFKKIMPYLRYRSANKEFKNFLNNCGLFLINNDGCDFSNYEIGGSMDHLKKPFYLIIPNLNGVNVKDVEKIFNYRFYEAVYILLHDYTPGTNIKKYFFEYNEKPVVFFKRFSGPNHEIFGESKKKLYLKIMSRYSKRFFRTDDHKYMLYENFKSKLTSDINNKIINFNRKLETFNAYHTWVVKNYSIKSVKFIGYLKFKDDNDIIESIEPYWHYMLKKIK